MKKLIIICVVGLSITLLAGSTANASLSQSSAEAKLVYNSSYTVITDDPDMLPYSWSYARAVDWELVQHLDQGSKTDTYALAEVTSARAESQTSEGWVRANAFAQPPPSVWSSGTSEPVMKSKGRQLLYFQANDSTVTLNLDYAFLQELDTDVPGDYASASSSAAISLCDAYGELDYERIGFDNYVSDGAFGPFSDAGWLTVSGTFGIGDYGCVYISAHTTSEAYTTPAPGAFFLGSLGLSFAGWRLRRRTTLERE